MKAKVFKKKKLILCCAAIVLIIAVALCLLFSCGNHKASEIAPPSDSLSISRTPPKDGSLPDQYEGIDNIAYIIGRLAEREYYHSETLGQVEASVLFITAGQTIYGSKDYKNGILLTSSVSISNNAFAPSKAIQRFYGDGKVVVRGAATPSSEWTGSDVEWSTGEPSEILDEAQYQERYGLWADEFSDYVINEETVLEVTPIEKTEDGNYTFTASLDGEQSTYYYKHQMVTMGDLDDYPVFSSVKLTFTFGADWTIYSLGIKEEYTSRKGVDASCKGSSVITYSYEEADADVSDYEEYFIRYADAAATGAGDKELTAADYLTYGFASFLTDEVALDADVSIGGSALSVQILLDMRGLSFNSLKGRLGSLSFAYSENKIYLDYKDMQGYLNVSDILSLLGGSGGSQLDTDALMEDVMNSEIAKDGENVTLSCTLDLGSMQIPVRFGFTEREGEVSFGYIEADLEALGTDISVHAALAAEKPEISVPETAVDLYPYIESVKSLAEGRKYELGVSYKNEEMGLAVDGSVNVDAASGIAVSGDIAVTYGGLSIPVGFTYVGDTVYLSTYNIKVSATSEEIASAVEAILAAANAEQPEISGIEIDAGKIVAAIIGLNFDEVIEELRLTGEGLYLTVDLDGLLSGLLGSETELGSLSAKYELATNTFTVQAMGAEVCFGGSEAEVAAPEDAADYVSLSRLTQFVKPVKEIIESKDLALSGGFDLLVGDVAVRVSLQGEIRFSDDVQAYAELGVLASDGSETQAKIAYADGVLYLNLFGASAKLSVEDVEKLTDLFGGAETDGATAALASVFENFDLGAFLSGIELIAAQEDAIRLTAELGALLGEVGKISVVLDEQDGKIVLSADGLELFGLQVRNIAVSAWSGTGEYVFSTEGAVDLYPYIESVKSLAEGRKYELGVSYKNEEMGLAVDGSVNVDAASGIAVSGDIAVTYGELSIPVGFTYVGDTVYLSAYNIKVSATSEEIASAVEAILAAANAEQPEISGIEIDAGKIVAAIIGLNFDEVIEELRLTGEGLYLTVDLDGLLSGLLGSETELGSLSAKYELATNTFTVQAMGAEVCFGGSEAEVAAPEDAADYVSLSRLTQFVKPVQEIINSNGAAFELSFDTKIEDVAMSAALAGEVRIADGGLDSLLLRVVLTIGGQEETVYIFYNSEGITLGYGGYNMRLSVGDLEKLQSSLQGLISGGAADESSRGVMLFMSEFDLGGFLHSLQLLSDSENAVTLIADLSDILGEGNEAFSVRAELLNGNKISLTAAKLSVLGLTAENLNVVASPVPEAYESDTSFLQWPNCDNVFEFVLAAYSKLFETEYLGLALSYAEEGGVSADVAGRVQFDTAVSEAKEVTVTLNLDFRAKVTADGQSHYLEAVILEDTLWASYSVKGFGADTALKVTLPISQLFVAGSTILPILAPILGISEDVYYYQFVDAILNGYAEMSEYYNTINSDIFGLPLYGEGTSAFDAWVDLILGIVGEYTGAPEAKTQEAEASAGSVSFTYGTSAAGNLYANILSGGMSVSLYALENAEPIGEDGYVLGGAQEAIAAPAGEYIDMSSIAQLLKDVLKAYDYANPSQGYHLSGTVTLDMNLALGSLPLATCSVPIDIDVRIGFDDAGTPSVYIKMQVAENSLKIAGFIPVKIVETDTVTELAIQNGNVYVARATSADGTNVNYANETVAYRFTGETEEGWLWKTVYNNYSTVTKKSYGDPVQYRAMTLASFLGGDIASIMEHMSFMLSLSSTVQSALDLALPDPNDDNTDSDNSASAVYDAGEMVKAYTFADNQYRLTLDMAAVAGDESFGDLNVNITRADDGELTALNGDLSILDFISIDFDFAHVDPGTHSEALAKCDEVEELVLSGGAQIPEEGYASGTVYRNAYVSYAEGTDKIKKSEDGRFADWLGYVLENGAWIQREWTIEDFISAVA